ncbi:polyadenylate-binding protein RBP45C-like isoform X1 [Durio zibethinus]|uniref:Polyadenylate-binding protein RBP45C-like isoform X1 n=1 Tax=Durio zibethinus TaxID=66656 RepID=A0A6P5ZL35_DURZI|nr:polyadenylate-binding protein RBP45C-like isoform X1 [Durio zibethinus]
MMQQPASGGVAPPPSMALDHSQAHQYQPQPQSQQWMMMSQQQQQAGQPVPPPSAWNPQPVPPPSQMQQYTAGSAAVGSGEFRSLWIGDLQQWMDENYLISIFAHTGEVVSAKVIRNKQTSLPEGYGFIEFVSHAAAERILQSYNGVAMPNSEQNFRLNWAALGYGEKRQEEGPDYTIFVGDLAADVSDYMLQETFKAVYPSVKGAKVVTDRTTGRSKGYGFVKFGDETEQIRAMTEMNGIYCSTRAMRIGPASNKKPVTGQQYQKATYQNAQGSPGENDPNNTTIFVGGLDPSVSEDQLKQIFSQLGEVVHVKIPANKNCGFVQYANRTSAEQALSVLNGTVLGGRNVRLSWGRSPSSKQFQAQPDQAQWNGGYYGYAQGYEAYGYAPPPQDPNMYYGGYPGYGNYQQPGAYQQPQQ